MESPTLKEQGYLPRRYLVAIMAFLGMICNYMLRINMNLAVVAMSVQGGGDNESHASSEAEEVCGFTDGGNDPGDEEGTFEWNEFTQSLITSSFFWGYVWTQIPGGRIAELFGARRVFGGALVLASILTFFIPLSAQDNPTYLIINRVLLGISEGATFPSTHALLSTWAPPKERSTLSTIIYAGSQAGTVVGYPLTSALITSMGWESVFYVQGVMTLVWCVFWFVLVADSPRQHKTISAAEKEYILASIGEHKKMKPPPVPLKAALTSLPFYAILLSNMGNNWGFYTLLTDLPLYMSNMLVTDIKKNATLSSLPYLGMWIFSLIISKVGDTLIQKNILSTGVVRKTANTISQVGPALCLLGVTLVKCDRTATVVLFFTAASLQGGIYTGFMVNHIDIAPNFAGTLFGITNAFSTIPSWVAPMTVGALTNNRQTFEQWDKVFYIAAAIFIANAVFYLIFASGEVQPWNDQETEEERRSKEQQRAVSTVTQAKEQVAMGGVRGADNPGYDNAYDVYVVTPQTKDYIYGNPAYRQK